MQMLSVAASERGVHPDDHAVVGVEAESETVVVFERSKIQVVPRQRDLARVGEEGRLETGPDLPAILALEQDRMRTAEPICPESAQRVVPAARDRCV